MMSYVSLLPISSSIAPPIIIFSSATAYVYTWAHLSSSDFTTVGVKRLMSVSVRKGQGNQPTLEVIILMKIEILTSENCQKF